MDSRMEYFPHRLISFIPAHSFISEFARATSLSDPKIRTDWFDPLSHSLILLFGMDRDDATLNGKRATGNSNFIFFNSSFAHWISPLVSLIPIELSAFILKLMRVKYFIERCIFSFGFSLTSVKNIDLICDLNPIRIFALLHPRMAALLKESVSV